MECALSLGSNLGDRVAHLRAAREAIAALPDVHLVAQAPLYETAPVGVRPEYQHLSFINTVLILDTELSPGALHDSLARVETLLGRTRGVDRFAPRPIDIDLLYVGDTVVNTSRLTLPHPQIFNRRFVLQPLADVRPDKFFPTVGTSGTTIFQWLENLPKNEKVSLFATLW